MGDPAPTGARVVILDTAVQPLTIAEADLGIPWNWRVGPGNAAASDPIMQALTFTPSGRGLMPFAPTQPRMRREANGDLAIRWLRRDRALSADSWVLADVPMSEAAELYDLEILSAGAVVRTVTGLTAPSFLYTAADQTADFGGPATVFLLAAERLAQAGGQLIRQRDVAVGVGFDPCSLRARFLGLALEGRARPAAILFSSFSTSAGVISVTSLLPQWGATSLCSMDFWSDALVGARFGRCSSM